MQARSQDLKKGGLLDAVAAHSREAQMKCLRMALMMTLHHE